MAPEKQSGDGILAAGDGKVAAAGKRGYVTFLAGNGDYVKGVVGLAKGLRKVNSAYKLVVAVLPDVPEEHRKILRLQGCVVREIEPVYPPENQVQFAMAYYVINYSKIRIWNEECNATLASRYGDSSSYQHDVDVEAWMTVACDSMKDWVYGYTLDDSPMSSVVLLLIQEGVEYTSTIPRILRKDFYLNDR